MFSRSSSIKPVIKDLWKIVQRREAASLVGNEISLFVLVVLLLYLFDAMMNVCEVYVTLAENLRVTRSLWSKTAKNTD